MSEVALKVKYNDDSEFDCVRRIASKLGLSMPESDYDSISLTQLRRIERAINASFCDMSELNTLRQQNADFVELVEQSFIEGCKTGYSNGLNDGQSWSNWKTTNEPSAEWECSDSKQLLSKIKGEKDANRN